MNYGLSVTVATATWPQATCVSILYILTQHGMCLSLFCGLYVILILYQGIRRCAFGAPRTHFRCSNVRRWRHNVIAPRVDSTIVLGYIRDGLPRTAYSKCSIALRQVRSLHMHVHYFECEPRRQQSTNCSCSIQFLAPGSNR